MKTACHVLFLLIIATKASIGAEVDDLFDQVKSKLPPGWIATRTETGINIRREKPIYLYNPISLPIVDTEKYIFKIEYTYNLNLTCKPKFSSEKVYRLDYENTKKEKEIDVMQEKMRGFSKKGEYRPSTPDEKSLYEDYKAKLKSTSFHVLPDGKFGESFVYVESTIPHGYLTFYDTRDKYSCLSAISTIFSVIEPVEVEPARFDFKCKQATDILWGDRPWERHAERKEREHVE